MPVKAFNFPDPVARGIEAMGYESPTPIQSRAIPLLMAGRDVIGSAQTGTGKTAAFMLPLLSLLGKHQAGSPRVLVLEPTRELTAQVTDVWLRGRRILDSGAVTGEPTGRYLARPTAR